MKSRENLAVYIEKKLNTGVKLESILEKISGIYSIMDAIVATRSACKISLGNAKDIVTSSGFWNNQIRENHLLHEIGEIVFSLEKDDSVKIIFPYKFNNSWVFDEESPQIKKQDIFINNPFFIEKEMDKILSSGKEVVLIFSDQMLIDHDFILNRKYFKNSYIEGIKKETVVFSDRLMSFFKNKPKKIWVKLKFISKYE